MLVHDDFKEIKFWRIKMSDKIVRILASETDAPHVWKLEEEEEGEREKGERKERISRNRIKQKERSNPLHSFRALLPK